MHHFLKEANIHNVNWMSHLLWPPHFRYFFVYTFCHLRNHWQSYLCVGVISLNCLPLFQKYFCK